VPLARTRRVRRFLSSGTQRVSSWMPPKQEWAGLRISATGPRLAGGRESCVKVAGRVFGGERRRDRSRARESRSAGSRHSTHSSGGTTAIATVPRWKRLRNSPSSVRSPPRLGSMAMSGHRSGRRDRRGRCAGALGRATRDGRETVLRTSAAEVSRVRFDFSYRRKSVTT
jgi:hypothetical protein